MFAGKIFVIKICETRLRPLHLVYGEYNHTNNLRYLVLETFKSLMYLDPKLLSFYYKYF